MKIRYGKLTFSVFTELKFVLCELKIEFPLRGVEHIIR